MRKTARDQLHTLRRLRRLLRSNRTVIARLLAPDPAPGSAERQLFESLFAFLDGELEDFEDDLWQAESLYLAVRERVAKARQVRDRAASDLRAIHTPVYRQLARYPAGERAGISGAAPDTPTRLVYCVPTTIKLLKEMNDEPPPPIGGVKIDPGLLATDLDTGLEALEDALTALDHGNSEVRLALEQANGERSQAKHVTPPVGRVREGLGGLAGRGRFIADVRRCFA